MNAAINVLQIALENLETNEPIHRDEGNIEQAELEASSAEDLRAAIGLIQMCSDTRFKRDTQITVASPNLPDGPAWFTLAEWDTVRKCYVTLDPMYPHPKTNESAASRLAFVLRMHDDNYRMLDGEKRKAWNDEFLKTETRQALAEFDESKSAHDKRYKILAEHNGCGNGTQVEQITVKLDPGDEVRLVSKEY